MHSYQPRFLVMLKSRASVAAETAVTDALYVVRCDKSIPKPKLICKA